jgi:hypothetical protein
VTKKFCGRTNFIRKSHAELSIPDKRFQPDSRHMRPESRLVNGCPRLATWLSRVRSRCIRICSLFGIVACFGDKALRHLHGVGLVRGDLDDLGRRGLGRESEQS